MIRTSLIVLLFLPAIALAQVYKTTDANGNVVYTDSPPAGSQATKVELNPINTSAPPPEVERPAPAVEVEQEIIEYRVEIMSPSNETTIAMGPGNLTVSATVAPMPAGGNRLQLMMDGAPRGEPQLETTWAMTNVFRGAHDLTVDVIDESGKSLARSIPVRIYVLRPSVNN